MSARLVDVKRRIKESLQERNTLTYETVSEAAYAYDIATGHATGVAQFEAMLEFLAEGHELYLEGFSAQGTAPTRIRTAHELARVIEAHFPYVPLSKDEDLGKYFDDPQ